MITDIQKNTLKSAGWKVYCKGGTASSYDGDFLHGLVNPQGKEVLVDYDPDALWSDAFRIHSKGQTE